MIKYSLVSTLLAGAILGCSLAVAAQPGERYNSEEDAAVAQAKIWQGGGKARPLMSSDGKIVFAFGQSMPRLTCSPTRACDVEMEPNEKVKKVILGDGTNWTWSPAESIEHGKTVAHVVLQPRDINLESNAIITTDRRTYHIKLYAPKIEGAYLNRIGFYYPEELVSSWAEKAGAEVEQKVKDESATVMRNPVSIDKLAFDYRIDGAAPFRPIRVFNDGERTYFEMPDALRNGENPILMLVDEKGSAMVVNYRREEDAATGAIHYVVDKLVTKAELRAGSEKVQITWKRKEKSFWGFNS
jgi:type IV secretion system protein VirB9